MNRTYRTAIGGERGSTVIEFAMVLPFIALLFMGILDFGRYYFTRLTLQHAVHEAARFAVTGNSLEDSKGNAMTRAESIKQVILEQASELDLDVSRLDVNPADGGGPGEVVTVLGGFTFEFLTPGIKAMVPGGSHDFSISASMRNEPFFRPAGGGGGGGDGGSDDGGSDDGSSG